MAARKTPAKGYKPDKIMRDALLLELSEQMKIQDEHGKAKSFRRVRMVAKALVDAAIAQDVSAIKEIFDRVDGKVASVMAVRPAEEGEGGTIRFIMESGPEPITIEGTVAK